MDQIEKVVWAALPLARLLGLHPDDPVCPTVEGLTDEAPATLRGSK